MTKITKKHTEKHSSVVPVWIVEIPCPKTISRCLKFSAYVEARRPWARFTKYLTTYHQITLSL